MCFGKLFKKKLKIPYPEEKIDLSKNESNTDVQATFEHFLSNRIPKQYRDEWRHRITLILNDNYYYPAATVNDGLGNAIITIQSAFTNDGVYAHEIAHIVWQDLTSIQKQNFASMHDALKDSNELMKLLYSENPYGLTNHVEGHAEIFRYLGEYMPEGLKQYYPRLL